LKDPSQKSAGGLAQGEDPEFNPQYYKKMFARPHLNGKWWCMPVNPAVAGSIK
jgi:hypothetical protein